MNNLPKWKLTNPFPSFYDTESGTAIEMTAKVYAAVQSLIDECNKFVDETQTKINNFTGTTQEEREVFASALRQEFQDFIDVVNLKSEALDVLWEDYKSIKEELKDAVVVNGEIRLPSKGLEYTLSEDGTFYAVTGLGTCMDKNIVVPRTYNGKPVTMFSVYPRENDFVESINFYEDVIHIRGDAFSKWNSLRFIYIYNPTPFTIINPIFPESLQGIFVPLHSVDAYKAYTGWSSYQDKIVAIETPESINATIVKMVGLLQTVDQAIVDAMNTNVSNLAQVDKGLGDEINKLKYCTIKIYETPGSYPLVRLVPVSITLSALFNSIGGFSFNGGDMRRLIFVYGADGESHIECGSRNLDNMTEETSEILSSDFVYDNYGNLTITPGATHEVILYAD